MANFSSYVGEFSVCDIGWGTSQTISKQHHWNILTPWNTYFQREILNTGIWFSSFVGQRKHFPFPSFFSLYCFKKQLKRSHACFSSSIIFLVAETFLSLTLQHYRNNIIDFIFQVCLWFRLHFGWGRNLKNVMPTRITVKVKNLSDCLMRFSILHHKRNMELCQNRMEIPIMFSVANLNA